MIASWDRQSAAERTKHGRGWIWLCVIVACVAGAYLLNSHGHTTSHTPKSSGQVDLATCGADKATGTVVNWTSEVRDYDVWVNYTNRDGVQLGSGVGSVYNLAPGATARWTASLLIQGSTGGGQCTIAKTVESRA